MSLGYAAKYEETALRILVALLSNGQYYISKDHSGGTPGIVSDAFELAEAFLSHSKFLTSAP